jgi:intracellular septation protein
MGQIRYHTRPFSNSRHHRDSKLMQLLLEFAPLLAFFVAYQYGGIYTATAVLMVAMVLLLVINRIRTGKVTPLLAISTVLVLVFGAVTLWLRDERFIQWKPTVFFWAIGLAFLASQWIGAKPFAQRLMEAAMGELRVPDPAWRRVNLAWVVFYAAMGAANLIVARSFSEQFWVNFKAFGLTGLTLIFVIAQSLWLQRQATEMPADGEPKP